MNDFRLYSTKTTRCPGDQSAQETNPHLSNG